MRRTLAGGCLLRLHRRRYADALMNSPAPFLELLAGALIADTKSWNRYAMPFGMPVTIAQRKTVHLITFRIWTLPVNSASLVYCSRSQDAVDLHQCLPHANTVAFVHSRVEVCTGRRKHQNGGTVLEPAHFLAAA